jgi:hypothetical protein
MFTSFRTIHLCAALFSTAFLAMYGISAVQMAHTKWFSMKPGVSIQELPVTPGLTNARDAARELMVRHHLRGELQSVDARATDLRFRIVRPGTVYEVVYTPASGMARVKTSTAGFMGMLNRIHHVNGLWHEWALLNVWGGLVGLVSMGLFLLGATGLYLWFKTRRERRIGIVLLTIGTLLPLGLLISMRLS